MNLTVYDYIIVGQGLAGTALAVELMRRKKTVLIFNDPDLHSSSMAAAGIFNPITGRRWVTTWKAQEVFACFPKFYKELEKLVNAKFFHEMPVFRFFQNMQEQNHWLSLPAAEVPAFVQEITRPGNYSEFIKDSYGGILLNNSGYLNVSIFLKALKNYFMELGIYRQEKVTLDNINWQSPFAVNGSTADRLILCLGYEGVRKTPFGDKPFNAVKGELLEVETSVQLPEMIFNGPAFILPQSDGLIKVGATYDFNDETMETTIKAREILLERIHSFFLPEIRIRNQIAGFRPSSVDRRPVAGEHPHNKKLGILNGLGTKGVSLAPYISKLLADKFENGKELDREIDIKRFFD